MQRNAAYGHFDADENYELRANTESKEASAKEALKEIKEMHRAWKEKLKLEAGTMGGELSEEGG